MLCKEAKPILRQMLKHYGLYGGMLFIEDASFKAYRYSGDGALVYLDKAVGDNEKLFYDVIELYKRHYEYRHYLQEVAPQWKVVTYHYFADNSVEVEEINKYGETRYRMIEAPKGDLCY